MKVISVNRKARHDYDVIDSFEAGIELKGCEVKSLRMARVNLKDSFITIEASQAVVNNMHISEFDKASYFKEDPYRKRRLLVHKKEIYKLAGFISQKGMTVIPLKIYFNDRGIAKLEIGICKGRKTFDKRKKIQEKYAKREADRAIKNYRKYN